MYAALARWLAPRLFGVPAFDPVTLASVAGLLVGTALVATWIPVRRATAVDPSIVLRSE